MADNARILDVPAVSLHGAGDWRGTQLTVSADLLRRSRTLHRRHMLVVIGALSRHIRRRR